MEVIGTIYNGSNRFGDFNWMIKNPIYNDALFLFNDNEEYHNTCQPGAGNAIIRKYNKFSDLVVPRSAGIPTGTMRAGGYTKFNHEIKNKIDGYYNEIKELIEKHKYTTIYYSSEPTGLIGTSIFKVNYKVLEYITSKIHLFSNGTIKIIKNISSINHHFDESYFDQSESESESDSESNSQIDEDK